MNRMFYYCGGIFLGLGLLFLTGCRKPVVIEPVLPPKTPLSEEIGKTVLKEGAGTVTGIAIKETWERAEPHLFNQQNGNSNHSSSPPPAMAVPAPSSQRYYPPPPPLRMAPSSQRPIPFAPQSGTAPSSQRPIPFASP